jgi:hypothetical protein
VTTIATGMEPLELDFWDWLAYGQIRNWCSNVVCETHDGVEMTDEEIAMWEEGGDPCIHVIRVYGD